MESSEPNLGSYNIVTFATFCWSNKAQEQAQFKRKEIDYFWMEGVSKNL